MSIVRSPATALLPGSLFRGYEIVAEVGAGTFGKVYEARHALTGQRVAIKISSLLIAAADDLPRTAERFWHEMRLCGALAHPHIVRLIESGESDDGVLYAVFQFVPGQTLKQLLQREGRLELPEAVHLMSQVLDALSCAHAAGIVHRDLKPENIMIMKTGARRNAMVLDFGLGAFTSEAGQGESAAGAPTRELMGTPCYAAPEQLLGEPPSTRSDLYSWGLIFLECLTGELAVGGGSSHEVVYRQLDSEPVQIPDWIRRHRLGRLLATVTSKAIEKRDVTIEALLEALNGAEVSAPPAEWVAEAPAVPGERRQLTVIACRLNVRCPPDEGVDPEEIDELWHLHHASCAQIVGRAGGRAAGILADRALFVFGYPHAREDDARRAARAALQIAAEVERAARRLDGVPDVSFAARVGVHTGVVLVRALRQRHGETLDQLAGVTAQVAMELAELAPLGTALASDDTRRLLGDDLLTEPAGAVTTAELPRPLPAFRLLPQTRNAEDGSGSAGRRETALVGRSRQLGELLECWQDAAAGRPAVVLLRGEPGIGKSRLARELRRRVPGEAWLQTRCLAENQDSPLRPLVDLLGTIDEPIESLLLRLGLDRDETVPLFASLLSWPADRYVPLPLTPERQKELTLNALVTVFLRLATQPLVLAFEDLHWADVTTLEFLGQLVRERNAGRSGVGATAKLCVVFTARPEFEPSWQSDHFRSIQLARLDEREVAEMIRAGLDAGANLPAAVVADVVQRADGIPLFVEEVTRVLLESEATSAAARDGRHRFQVPATLRALLTARLDTVSPGAKESAQLAAVLGREFRYELLRAVSTKDEADLRDDLAGLQATGLIFLRRSLRGESYVFKHALVRDAAYDSLTKSMRQRLHQRVASTLRLQFPDIERHRPELLATHFERGGQLPAAIEYLHLAGSHALHRAAYQESFILLDRALSLLRSLKPSPTHRRQEVELLATLGNVQISTSGYAAAEVEETFRRAWSQCEELGGDIPTHVLFGIWGVNVTRSDRSGVGAILPRLQRIVADSNDPVALTAAYAALGAAAYWDGDCVASQRLFARGRECFYAEEFSRFAQTYGYGAGLYSFAFGMPVLWMSGYPEQALAVRDELFAISGRARDPYVTMVAEGLWMTIAHECDEPEVELEIADRLMALANEQRSALWRAAALIGQGGALTRRGHVDEAATRIRKGLDAFKLIGIMCSYTYFLPYLADAYVRAGKLPEGLGVIDEGLELSRTLVAKLQEPELLRLRGEIVFQRGERDEARRCFERAVALVQRGQGRSYELRATMSLARLWREEGRCAEARSLLQQRYGWFTEGFDTPDLRAARSLLAELA